jgi:hypothetical protein
MDSWTMINNWTRSTTIVVILKWIGQRKIRCHYCGNSYVQGYRRDWTYTAQFTSQGPYNLFVNSWPSIINHLIYLIDNQVIWLFLSIVVFLRSSSCFPAEVKTRSIPWFPSPDTGEPWNCLHILTTSWYVRFTWRWPDNFPCQQWDMSSQWLKLSLEM